MADPIVPEQVAAPVQPAAPSPAPEALPAAPSPAPALPSAPVPGAATPAPQEYVGVREALAGYGLDLRQQFPDDHAALQHLAVQAQRAQQLEQMAQYGQVYLRHADQFQAWQRQQQEAQAKAQEQKPWWQAPDYDPSWLSKLTRDPTTGELKAVAGADPALVQKYQQWREHQSGFLDRFSKDPLGAIKPGVEQVAREVAQQLIQQHLGGYQEQQAARGFVEQNSGWLHQKDAQGALVRDQQTGRPQLSALGQAFAGYVRKAEEVGIRDVAGQQEYALALTQRDALLVKLQSASPGQPAQPVVPPGELQKQQFLQQAQQRAATPGQPAPVQGSAVPAQGGVRGLAEMLMKDLGANGFMPGQELPRIEPRAA